VIDRDLTADDGLDARTRRGDRKLERREHVVGVGDGDGRHARRQAQVRQLLQPHGAFEEGVFRVDAKVDESGPAAHAPTLAEPRAEGNAA
jgi:hypothetical protein